MFGIGLSYCGATPEKLDEKQKASLISALDEIHKRNVVYGHITKENEVENTRDFGREMQELLRCLELF
jgi:hypothetical protein